MKLPFDTGALKLQFVRGGVKVPSDLGLIQAPCALIVMTVAGATIGPAAKRCVAACEIRG